MKELSDKSQLPFENCVLTLGNFDGVHVGHQSLVESLVQLSNETNYPSVVLSFSPHPKKVFESKKFLRLLPEQETFYQLQKLNVDFWFRKEFNKNVAMWSPETFLDFIISHLKPKKILLGYDFKFGFQASGDFDLAKEYCSSYGIEVLQSAPFTFDNEVVSTSRVKSLFLSGQWDSVRHMLGRPFSISGRVVSGEKKGRTIGFRTANLDLEDLKGCFVPSPGVYFGFVYLESQEKFGMVVNIGYRPSVSREQKLTIEAHVLDADLDLYGQNLRLEILDFIRAEKKFSSLEDLKTQIAADCLDARERLTKV